MTGRIKDLAIRAQEGSADAKRQIRELSLKPLPVIPIQAVAMLDEDAGENLCQSDDDFIAEATRFGEVEDQ